MTERNYYRSRVSTAVEKWKYSCGAKSSRVSSSRAYSAAHIQKKLTESEFFSYVRRRGLEPPRLAALVPKTSAYTNSATCAYFVFKPVGNRAHLSICRESLLTGAVHLSHRTRFAPCNMFKVFDPYREQNCLFTQGGQTRFAHLSTL